MIKIGLTGNIAAGKTEIKKLFEKQGIKTICADSIVHELLENNEILLYNIRKEFSDVYIFSENKIDRKKLGKIVFSNKDKKKKLENLIHPLVVNVINSFYNKNYLKSIFLTRGFLSLLYVPIHFLSTAKKTKLISSTLSKSQ